MAEPIRILHFVVGMNRGGIEGLLMNIYRSIDRQSVQFDFFVSMDGIYDDEIRSLGGKIFKFPFISSVGPFAYKKNICRFLDEHKEYKIVHAHMDKFGGIVMECAKKCNVPVRIIHSHNIQNEGSFFIRAVKNYYGMKYKSATHFFACSEEGAQWMFPDKADDAVILKNGIITDNFLPKDTRDRNFFTIGNVARFTQQKNHAFLIDVFSKIYSQDKSARLMLAGQGPLMNDIKTKCEREGLSDAVIFAGDCDDVPGFLSGLDVFCFPSLFEGLGIALVEAQCCGLQCVASDTVPKEADVTGTVKFIPLGDGADKWAELILSCKNKPRLDNVQKIRDAGYDIAQSAQKLEQFYLSLL